MVLRACRGVLHDAHDAEDAFQATFLVLARKAGTIRKGDSVASWLFGVARRVAVRADGRRKRRAAHEAPGEAIIAMAEAPPSDGPPGPMPEVLEEVDRLPERYRVPVVLCYFEGLTQEEAAIRLRLPASTVRVRLMRARTRLRDRLTRRGLAPAALVALSTAGRAEAAVPAPLVDETISAATRFAAGRAAGVSAPVAALVQGVFRAMFLAKLKSAAALLAVLLLTSAWMLASFAGPAKSPPDPPPAVAQEPTPKPAAADTPKAKDQGRAVSVWAVRRADWKRKTAQVGTVTAFQSADLYARIPGYVKTLNVDIGSRVKKGDEIAELEAPEVMAEYARAQAEVHRAKVGISKAVAAADVGNAAIEVENARIEVATSAADEAKAKLDLQKKELDYTRRLAEKSSISQNEVALAAGKYAAAQSAAAAALAQVSVARAASREAQARLQGARSDIEDARSNLHIAEAALDSAAINVRYTRITSPYDGVVTRRNYHAGNFVRAAGVGDVEPIATVVRTDLMRVVCGVPETEVPYLDPGDPATVRIASLGGPGVYKGRVARTAYALNANDRTVRTEIDLPNPDGRLRPGQVGAVDIELESRDNVLTIPTTALLGWDQEGNSHCFRVVYGHAVLTPIKVAGHATGDLMVLDGLKEGDAVILSPGDGINNGEAVTIRPDENPPAR